MAENGSPSGGGGIFAEVDAEAPPILNPQEGETVGDFHMTKKLGEGSMASVWRAEHVPSQTPVALKVLKAELCHNIDAMRRFDKEALVAKRAHHPNLVEITDVVHIDGFPPILIMELLEGSDVATAVAKHGPFTPEKTMTVTSQLCGALEAIHSQLIVHRDLKTDNVFLVGGDEGYPVVKLLDFGLVKFLFDGDPFIHTQAGAVIGTPAFMAPEQFGNPEVDRTADIYAVGVCMYEMLTGRTPYVSTSYTEHVKMVHEQDPEPPSKYRNPDLPPIPADLEALIMRCLARDPDHRIPTAAEVKELLDASVEGDGKMELPPLPGKAHPVLKIVLIAAGVVAVLGLLMFLAWRA